MVKTFRYLAVAILVLILGLQPVLAADPPTNRSGVNQSTAQRTHPADISPMYSDRVPPEARVISSFNANASAAEAWSIGYNDRAGKLWVGDYGDMNVREFTTAGAETGKTWAGALFDMEYDAGRNIFYQVNAVGSDHDIHTWNPKTGVHGKNITDPNGVWTKNSQRGVAYDPTTDTLYVGNWSDGSDPNPDNNYGMIYRIQGLSWPKPGKIIKSWDFAGVAGLAWLGNGKLAVTVSWLEPEWNRVYVVRASEMAVLQSYLVPGGGQGSAGIDGAPDGTAWLINQANGYAYHIAFDTPAGITAPTAGETLQSGSVYTVTWNAIPEATSFKVKYSLDGGTTWAPMHPGLLGDVTEYPWVVPTVTGATKTKVKIKMQGYDDWGTQVSKAASAPFTIETLKLTSPNGGELLPALGSTTVTWETYPGSLMGSIKKAKLFYTLNNGLTWTPLQTNWTLGTAEASYTVPLPPAQKLNKAAFTLKLVLTDSTGKQYIDQSDSPNTIYPSF